MMSNQEKHDADLGAPLAPLVWRITQHDLADILRKQIESGDFARDVEARIRPYRDNLSRYNPFLILD